MKVFVIWDPLCEHVMSVHRTEEGADKEANKLDAKEGRKIYYLHECEEFIVEE